MVDELLIEGVELFNKQEYFECHEVLETLWNRQVDPEKQFTQGILQIAVGFYHLKRDNIDGARKLLARGLPRVKPFAPAFAGLDLSTFLQTVEGIALSLNDLPSGASLEQYVLALPKLLPPAEN